jgi:hypothetical protein
VRSLVRDNSFRNRPGPVWYLLAVAANRSVFQVIFRMELWRARHGGGARDNTVNILSLESLFLDNLSAAILI